MSNNSKRSKPISTPKVRVRWANVNKPNNFGKFSITVLMNPKEAEVKKFAKECLDEENRLREANGMQKVKKCSLFKTAENRKDGDDFEGLIEFSSNVNATTKDGQKKDPPTLVGPTRKKINKPVWGGDLIRLSFNMSYYNVSGKSGITTYPQAIQLLESNARSSVESAFDTEEGYDESIEADPIEPTGDAGDGEVIEGSEPDDDGADW